MVAGASHSLLSGLAIGINYSRKAIKGRLAIIINALKATTPRLAGTSTLPVDRHKQRGLERLSFVGPNGRHELSHVFQQQVRIRLNVAVPQVQPLEPERIKRMPGRVGDLTPSVDAVTQTIRSPENRLSGFGQDHDAAVRKLESGAKSGGVSKDILNSLDARLVSLARAKASHTPSKSVPITAVNCWQGGPAVFRALLRLAECLKWGALLIGGLRKPPALPDQFTCYQ
jgi:hypothetical protein